MTFSLKPMPDMDARSPQSADSKSTNTVAEHNRQWQWVEVAYAEPDEQFLLTVTLTKGLTVLDAIEQSGILEHRPELLIRDNTVGLFSQKTTLLTLLAHRDRVEIYRALINDPMDTRRRKAAEKV